MTYTTTEEMFARARQDGYAVVGVAAYDLETIKVAVGTAAHLQAPIMIQTTPATMDHIGGRYAAAIVGMVAETVHTPVALHLDHGDSFERVMDCLAAGYTSIMIDGSHLALDENVRLTGRVVAEAHARGVPVEAEIGRIGGVEDDVCVDGGDAGLTDPDEAADFVARTGVDSLAIAMGTAHGMYRMAPHLHLDVLAAVRARVTVPIVLHGASGVPDDAMRAAIAVGIVKFNIATELKQAYAQALRQFLIEHEEITDPRRYLHPALQAYACVVAQKLHVAGCVGRYAS